MAASAGSAFETPGAVWHQADKAAGNLPPGWHGLDQAAAWIQSSSQGWGDGYQAHVTMSVSPATGRMVLDATVTGSPCESHLLNERLEDLPPTLATWLLEAGDDDGDLIAACQQRGLEGLVPWAKPIGKSTSQARRDRAAHLASPAGKARYRQRGSSLEPFFATLKDFLGLDPLPVQGPMKASA